MIRQNDLLCRCISTFKQDPVIVGILFAFFSIGVLVSSILHDLQQNCMWKNILMIILCTMYIIIHILTSFYFYTGKMNGDTYSVSKDFESNSEADEKKKHFLFKCK